MATTAIALPDDYGLWRYGIISPLLHHRDEGQSLQTQIDALAQQVFYTPRGESRQICPGTIRNWLGRYRTRGIDGLRNKPRKDEGSSAVPEALAHVLADLRKAQPCWTLQRLLRAAKEQGQWNGYKPSRSALYRFAKGHSLHRALCRPPSSVHCFEYPFFGDLWIADFLHGPQTRRGNTVHKAYLHAIIDDATRYIVAARFHSAEDTRCMLDDLMRGIRRFGIPKRLYTDNGAAFRSRHLRSVAAKLGIALPHTPAYRPQGRGKIERFFRSVREGFLTGRGKTSLEKLNADFAAWLNQYHHSIHSALQMSPLNRKLSDRGPALKQIPATQDIDAIFRMEHITRVGSDGCVRMFTRRFEIPNAIPGSAITVYYLPWNHDCIYLADSTVAVKPLDTNKNATRFDKPHRGTSNPMHKEDRNEKTN